MPRTTDKLFKAIKQRIENAIECSPRISVIEKENIASDMLAIFVVELGRKNKAIAKLADKLREREQVLDHIHHVAAGASDSDKYKLLLSIISDVSKPTPPKKEG